MARPFKHPKTGVYYVRQRVPSDVSAKARGNRLVLPLEGGSSKITIGEGVVKASLRTKEPNIARERHAAAQAHLEKLWNALRAGPRRLSPKETTALAGELYRGFAEGGEDEPGHTGDWLSVIRMNTDADQGKYSSLQIPMPGGTPPEDVRRLRKLTMERRFGAMTDALLSSKALVIDQDSRERLLAAVEKALTQAAEKLKRNAEGDFSPDPKANRFPEWSEKRGGTASGERVSLNGLVELWWAEKKKADFKIATHESYKGVVKAFALFLKHDDARRVTKQDVLDYKAHRIERVSAKTVKDNDLAALKTIFRWAVENGKLSSNPAQGVTIKVGKKPKLRPKWFRDDEAKAILAKATALVRGKESAKLFAAKRWVPWLLAYSGARVGEVAQLRKQDVSKKDQRWVMTLTPEAGTIKNNEARDVVLHEHLIELGFPDFLSKSKDGHLFLEVSTKGGSITTNMWGPLRTLKNRLREFVREIVTDKNVAPNHGWRHRFKTVGMEVGVDHRILDAIQGQQARTVAENYGDVNLTTQANAIAKFPKYSV